MWKDKKQLSHKDVSRPTVMDFLESLMKNANKNYVDILQNPPTRSRIMTYHYTKDGVLGFVWKHTVKMLQTK